MRNIAIGMTIPIGIVILLIGILVGTGKASELMQSIFVQPSYERLVSQFELLGVQPDDTVFLGDSLTEYGAWQELFPESNIRNRGIVGDTTTGLIARLDQAIEGQPAQVFLMIGTNDLFNGASQEEIVNNIVTIVDEIHETSPQTDIFVQSILPRGSRYQEPIESLNATLETAITGKATWVNLYPLFLDEAGTSLNDSLTNDELHLLGEAYFIWRDSIAHLVNTNNE